MNKRPDEFWFYYLETNVKKSTTVKLDRILEDRMKAFMKAKRVQRFKFGQ